LAALVALRLIPGAGTSPLADLMVVDVVAPDHESRHARRVDDAARSLPLHDRPGVLEPEEDAPQQDRHVRLILLHRRVQNARAPRYETGVVKHAVEPAELLHGSFDQSLHIGFQSQVGVTIGCGRTGFPRQSVPLAILNVGHDDTRPL
jgi:hypothetical protein